jgi:DNA-binding FadR family transcriptional regulator
MLAEYGVGRGTLREALRYLEMQGVITIRPGPGGGPTVSRPGPRHLARNLSIPLEFARARFRAIVETRSLIEPAVAAAAATRIDAEHLEEMRQSLERLRAHPGDIEVFLSENTHFHDLMAWSSGNTVFGYLLSSLEWISDGTAMGVQYPLWAQKVVAKAHQRIYEAIASGDAERARHEQASHLAEYVRYLEDRYPDILDQPIRWERLPT